jgi:2-polyprenyl-3-methyl-5-hydroxy-6-metoxy-1,4-benzoquinol methylase
MKDASKIQLFWENNHSENDEYWLTGSKLDHIKRFHDLKNYDFKNKTVLEIGVGLGFMTKELVDTGAKIIASDISKVALKKISKSVYKTIHTSLLNTEEQVDLAICHLVFQHCNDEEIHRLIRDVQLKDDGIFTFQFAFLYEEPNEKVKSLINNGMHHFRSIEKIKEMVDDSDKKISFISNPIHFVGSVPNQKNNKINYMISDENVGWYIVNLEKK